MTEIDEEKEMCAERKVSGRRGGALREIASAPKE